MDRFRPYLEELTRALLVLALVFFAFVHQPVPAVAHDGLGFVYTSIDYCGSAGPDDTQAHAPCHACRTGADAMLPPPPSDVVAVSLAIAPVAYATVAVPVQACLPFLANRNRGPPHFA